MINSRIYFSFSLLALLLSSCGGGSGGAGSGSDGITFTEYYVNAVNGSDGNNGLSRTTAWQTLSKISNTNFTTATKIFLNRGDSWSEPLILNNSNMSIDAYGNGALPKINGARIIAPWGNVGLGVYSAVVSLDTGQGLGNLSENNTLLNFVPWDNDVTTTLATASTGSYSYNYALSTLYIKPATEPNLNSYLASVELYGIYAKDISNISISNLYISRVSLNGIEFHNCVSCNVDNVTVSQVGGAVIGPNIIARPDYLYAGNGIDYSNSCSNSTVKNVTVSEIFDSCLAVELYLNNNHVSNIQLTNAVLSQCGFAGIEVSVLSNQGINTNSTIDNINMSSVTVDNAGKGWSGRRYGTDGHGVRIIADSGAGSMNNIRMSNVQVSESAGDGVKLAGEINTITIERVRSSRNDGVGINVAAPSATTLRLDLSASIIDKNTGYGISYNAPEAAGFKLYHNTFYNNGIINLAVFNQTGVADIRNNVFNSSAAMTHLFAASALVSPTIDNNCYNDSTNMFGYNGLVYSTVATFNSSTGFETNGVGDLPVALSNAAADVFTLSSTSSCRGLGVSGIGITSDYINSLYASPPSSGAYAYAP